MSKIKLTETERKALLQFNNFSFLSAVARKSKRSMALVYRLRDRGLITLDDDDSPFAAFLTAEGFTAIGEPVPEDMEE